MLSVLLIASDNDDLNIRSEVLTIQRIYRTQRATTFQDIYDITQDQQFDIIHVAAHGDHNGVYLTKGQEVESLGIDILARIAKKCRSKLVYFNSCNSARIGQYLLDQGIPAVIMTSMDIDDKQDAWSIAGYFYNELISNGGNYKAAYKISKPDNGALIWLSNGNYIDRDLEPILSDLGKIKEFMNDIPTYTDEKIRDIHREMDARIKTVKVDINRQRLIDLRIYGFVIMAFTLIVILALHLFIF